MKHIGLVCVYCGNLFSNQDILSCCGETHGEEAYEDKDGNLVLESELPVKIAGDPNGPVIGSSIEVTNDSTNDTTGDESPD